MSYHLHWLPGYPQRGKVGRYIHAHEGAFQSHFYAGDKPILLKETGSYPRGPRLLPDGSRNTKTHLRFPDGYGDHFLVCGAEPLNISLSRNGLITCANCARKITPIDSLMEDIRDYRASVDIALIERAVSFRDARESLQSLDKVRNQMIETMLHGPSSSSISPTASTGQGFGW